MATSVRFNLPPAQSVSVAKLGYNMESTFTDTAALAAVKAGGATYVRWQPAWSGVESYSSPGTYSLGTATETALAYCGANGLQPVAVCAYGPPYHNVFNLTVGSGGASIGAYTIPVTGSISSIITPTDHVMLTGNGELTAAGKWGYYGALIDSVNVGAGTITLASALTVNLTPGETIVVNRLAYASPADQLLTNPSLIAYFNYLNFVAERIAANGCNGYVTIWNEPPWTHDPWDARGKFYDTVPNGMNNDTRMKVFLEYALTITGMPAGVRIINGSTDKTGSDGINQQGLAPTIAQVAASISVESVHPYHNLPEGYLWDTSINNGSSSYQLLNTIVDFGSNFTTLARTEANANVGLSMMATECGSPEPDDTRQAVYLLRRVACSWACKMPPVIYSFAVDGAANYYNVAGPPSSYTPRAAYTALQNLTALVAELGGPGGTIESVPIVVGYQDQTWPMMGTGLYGSNGALLLLWQRTDADKQMPTLSSALSTSGPITSIPVAVPWAVTSGVNAAGITTVATIVDPTGAHSQTWTLSQNANQGDSSLIVNSATPNYAYPAGSLVSLPWDTVPTPSTYSAQFTMPSGYTITSATNVRTNAPVITSVSNGILTVEDIGEDVIGVLVSPI